MCQWKKFNGLNSSTYTIQQIGLQNASYSYHNAAFTSTILTTKTKCSTVNCLLISDGQCCHLMTSPYTSKLCQPVSTDL